MLHPQELATLGKAVEEQHEHRLTLPADIYGDRIRHHMSSVFDKTQFGAIAVRIATLASWAQGQNI